jgi:phenylalanyl-tRNA synthetase beta chain
MLCSAAELLLGDDESGIMILESGEPGQPLSDIFPPQAVLDIEVTSNRPDCLAHLGVARELAAVLRRDLKVDFMPPYQGGADPPATDVVSVTIEAPELCRRYLGALIRGVKVGPSPAWLARRLRMAGLRPINNVVDVTNYVLLEYGQPLHAFDLARLAGPEIRVRGARPGESLLCLDGETRDLDPQILVIADAGKAMAIAGVIGGQETAVTESTVDVLLESATFDGPSVRTTARRLGLRTEASARFEKSLPPELALAGARRGAALLAEVAGGTVHTGWPEQYPRPQEPVRVQVLPATIDETLGVHVPLEEMEDILKRLGFQVRIHPDGLWDVLPPVFRLDIAIPEDITEEVGRIFGYDRVPATLPGRPTQTWHVAQPSQGRRLDALREVLVGAGFTETVTPALVSYRRFAELGLDQQMGRADNPLSDEMDALRTSLLPSLLDVARLNRNRGRDRVAIFEIASVYLWPADGRRSESGQPAEPLRLGFVLSAGSDPEDGRQAIQRLKSVLERGVGELGVATPAYKRSGATLFHPGRTAGVELAGSALGHAGELHPSVLRYFDLEGRAAAAEIDLEPVLAAIAPRTARPLPRFPAVDRDLAVVVADEVPAADLLATIRSAGAPLLESVTAFDEYRGAQVDPGAKSVAFALTFRSSERTLTDAEVDQQMAGIRQELERRHAARFRS